MIESCMVPIWESNHDLTCFLGDLKYKKEKGVMAAFQLEYQTNNQHLIKMETRFMLWQTFKLFPKCQYLTHFAANKNFFLKHKYSGPSSYDRLDIRTTWVTTKILVLTYDQSRELRPACRSRPKRTVVNKDPRCVRKLQSEPRYARLWT